MWKHEIVDSATLFGDPVGKVFSSGQEFNLTSMGSYLDIICAAHRTFEGISNPYMGSDGLSLRLPYPTTMLSFLSPSHRSNKKQHETIVCQQQGEAIKIFHLDKSIGSRTFEMTPFAVVIDAHGGGTLSHIQGFHEHYASRPKLKEAAWFIGEAILRDAFLISAYVLTIINCRNVYVSSVSPDGIERRNHKRTKQGKPPLERYHVLKFCPGKISNKTASGIGTGANTGSMPVHLCRGHFMHVSPDRPLFGRPGCHGRFWVQPHVRGNKKNGVVVKDYEVVHGGNT